jgi:hypothetical protein
VLGSVTFTDIGDGGTNNCPQIGTLSQTALLGLYYVYPGVPNPMIDPSVVVPVTITGGRFWTITGGAGAVQGSYPTLSTSPTFNAELYPVVISPESCSGGVAAMYIERAQVPITGI